MSSPLSVQTNHGVDLQWAVRSGGQLTLEMCGLMCPDGAIDLVLAQHSEWPPAAAVSDTIARLLSEAIQEAHRRDVTPIRCLVSESTPLIASSVLLDQGFTRAAQLQEWSADVSDSRSEQTSSGFLELEEILFADDRRLRKLISGCLLDSLDLPALAPPTADALIDAWKALSKPEATIEEAPGTPAGLAVVTHDLKTQISTLEYVGVDHNMRRRGVGLRLLAKAQRAAASANCHTICGYCDTQNSPAVALYTSAHWKRGDRLAIWTRK